MTTTFRGFLSGFGERRLSPAEHELAFKAWFADSKVVDPAGKPLTVYHGSPYTFSVFQPENLDVSVTWNAFGSWFAKSAGYADKFTDDGGKVYEVYLSIRRPLKLRGDGAQGFGKLVKLYEKATGLKTFEATSESNAQFREYLKRKGYDGVILINFKGDTGLYPLPQDFYVVLDPRQVKSVQNIGTFDPRNPDIFHGVSK